MEWVDVKRRLLWAALLAGCALVQLLVEVVRRGGEAVSLLSCALNVVAGTGDREVTLSAGAWEVANNSQTRAACLYGCLLVWAIDGLNRPFNGPDHCFRSWVEHGPVWTKVRAEGGARG